MTNEDNTKRTRWEDLKTSHVTKTTLIWSCVGSVVVALIVGFTFGGWVTGGTARQMQQTAGESGRFDLVSALCVERFMAQPDMREQLAELQDIRSTFRQRQFIEAGAWAIMPGRDEASRQGADLCARVLANLDIDEFETLEETN